MKRFRNAAILIPMASITGCSWYEDMQYSYPWIDNVLVGLALLAAIIPALITWKLRFRQCERRKESGKSCWSSAWKWTIVVYAIEVILIFIVRFSDLIF